MSRLSEQQKQEILAAMEQGDNNIDFSDIPEITEIPQNAIRGKDWKHYRGKTILLTDEVHAYFSAIADRRKISINELVNDVLAKEIAVMEIVK